MPPFRLLDADPVRRAKSRWRRWSVRALGVALALSVAIHVGVSLWNPPLPSPPEETPLTATIETMPPPPPPAPAVAAAPPTRAVAPKPPRPRAAPRAPPPDGAAVVVASPDVATAEPGEVPGGGASRDERNAGSGSPSAIAETPRGSNASDATAIVGKTLPPRIDLAYKVFFGTSGFQVGDATYRFEHAQDRYRISTVGQARGLAALLLRGQGRLESRGLITATGLTPLEFSVDRFNGRGRETAQFDWDKGVVTLDGDKTETLAAPTFDPLTLMWQYYFTPPDADSVSIAVATTRRIGHYTLSREGRERLPWANGTIEAERWRRVSDDGRTEAYAWLAPDLRFIPVKMRVTNTTRGTLEAVLDAIRVDETGETVGRDDMALVPSPPSETHNRASHDATPGYSPPGATFPSMTP